MALYTLGDIHGKYPQLIKVLETLPLGATIIAVGDVGLGFPDTLTPDCLDAVNKVAQVRDQQLWLMRGNHDNPAVWNEQRRDWNAHLSNIHIPEDVHRMRVGNIHVMMVGGAISVDRAHAERIQGRNWWKDENVNPEALQKIQEFTASYGRADILITHAGPFEAKPGPERDEETFAYYAQIDPTIKKDAINERKLLSQIVEVSQTKTVAFGHYHVPTESNHGPVRYRCCAELEPWLYEKRSVLPPLPSL